MGAVRHWTPAEDNIAISLASTPGVRLKRVASELNRSETAVARRLMLLERRDDKSYRNWKSKATNGDTVWSAQQDERLVELSQDTKITIGTIAWKMGRTSEAIIKRQSELRALGHDVPYRERHTSGSKAKSFELRTEIRGCPTSIHGPSEAVCRQLADAMAQYIESRP